MELITQPSAGILEQSMGLGTVGIGLWYQPCSLHRLGLLKSLKILPSLFYRCSLLFPYCLGSCRNKYLYFSERRTS